MRKIWWSVAMWMAAAGCSSVPKTVGGTHEPVVAHPVAPVMPVIIDDAQVAAPAESESVEHVVEPEPAITAVGAYVAPAPFSEAERKAKFPRGNLGDARTKNREGLARRAADDAGGAKAAYAEALSLSPRFAPARYNLACELAREGNKEAALGELETLLRLATPDARLFVARARLDPDFASVREDPRFRGLVGQVRFDPTRPVAEQYCADPGRIADLIDEQRGVEIYVETESANEEKAIENFELRATGKEAFDRVARVMSELVWYACAEDDMGLTGTLKSYRLASAKDKQTCLAFEGQMEWSSQFLACFVNEDGWKLASISMFPDGPLNDTWEYSLKQRARAAKDRGYRNFGVEASR